MNLAKELLHNIANPDLSANERAQMRCRLARKLEEAGNYEAAREAMGELWQRVGERPLLEGLDQETTAALLLRTGALTGYIGSATQIEGAQETAKNLLSESIYLFEKLERPRELAEAQTEIAVCYWREGAFDEARVILQESLRTLAYEESEVKAVALLRSAIVERSAKRFHDALYIHNSAAAFFETISNDVLKGKFHHGFGTLLKKLGDAEQREDYIDQGLIEYTAASFYFQQAGLSRHQGCVENNLGFLYGTIGRFREAHDHLDRAQALFTTLKDSVHLAQVDETRARVMLAEGRAADAEKMVRAAVRTLEKGGEQSIFAEALTTHGIALARLKEPEQARATLERAAQVAEQAGDPESAGNAVLVVIEELGAELSNEDLFANVARADNLLQNTRDMTSVRRLAKCACRALSLGHAFPTHPDWTTFSLKEVMHRHEEHFLELALKDAGGRVTRAAQLLGLPGHQTLLSILTRHKNLLKVRTPATPRRQGIIRHGGEPRRSRRKVNRKARKAKILHVEDDGAVAGMIRETLAPENFEVEVCADASMAMKKIAGYARYDLLLLDYDLLGANGEKLVRQVRQLHHRRRTPIVVLSSMLDEESVRITGVDAFLRKPEDVMAVAETVGGLLGPRKN